MLAHHLTLPHYGVTGPAVHSPQECYLCRHVVPGKSLWAASYPETVVVTFRCMATDGHTATSDET